MIRFLFFIPIEILAILAMLLIVWLVLGLKGIAIFVLIACLLFIKH